MMIAKQVGMLPVSGSIGNRTYYRINGKQFVRKKSSLNKERVELDPAFANSRKASALFGEAARLASAIYQTLPQHLRKQWLISTLTREARDLLAVNTPRNDVAVRLLERVTGAAEDGSYSVLSTKY